jgi:hypothetical protein
MICVQCILNLPEIWLHSPNTTRRSASSNAALSLAVLDSSHFDGACGTLPSFGRHKPSLVPENDSAYKLGNYQFSNGKLEGIFDDRREMTDTIKTVVEGAAVECWQCAKLERE